MNPRFLRRAPLAAALVIAALTACSGAEQSLSPRGTAPAEQVPAP